MADPSAKEKELREKAVQAALDHFHEHHVKPEYKPGDKIQYGGRVYDEKEMRYLIESSLDFWLTSGRFTDRFERALGDYLGVKHVSMVNSGSSANLLAFMALTSPKLAKRRVLPGDEVITVAAGFPTTVAPIIQYGAVPVFLDVTLPEYNIDVKMLEKAVTDKTKAVMLAHTLGNPFDLQKVKDFCDQHHLWLIEDNCDSLGSRFKYNDEWRYTGTIGDIGTSSFYPPHHITTGEGGAVYTDDRELARIVNSFRDWGRDCHCAPGQDNACGQRFMQQFGELPYGYDHKYVYSHFGYNMKATDMQAAIGCAQVEKLPAFTEARKRNWKFMRERLGDLDKYFVLPEPTHNSDPSWFGFMMTVRPGADVSRDSIVDYLEGKKVQTRMLFAGNLIKHPCFDEMRKAKKGYRVVGELKNTDLIMANTFWIGVYPGLVQAQLDYMVECLRDYILSGA
ncbi:MAG: TDP-4-oxo-6-deoxy-D-glucose transaminase [Methanomassiliicoccales archaeon PtaU1.Bin124]|nr:MAG: TDP-4-oxo-6-deoxy-D-glucose transaminase [Methanomassiliicoccales archaeon PtaU1.Bin124]